MNPITCEKVKMVDQVQHPTVMQKVAGQFLYSSLSQDLQRPATYQRRAFHIEPGLREKTLLAPSPSLARFKSHKKDAQRVKRIGDILTIVVVAGCCYKIYVKAATREEARAQARATDVNAS